MSRQSELEKLSTVVLLGLLAFQLAGLALVLYVVGHFVAKFW